MKARDWAFYVRAKSAALAAHIASGDLPVAVEGNIIKVACRDIDHLIAEGKLPLLETLRPQRMEPNESLATHLWSGRGIARAVQQDGRTVLHHRCVRCGRDFAQGLDGAYGWQAAHVGLLRIELLAQSVNERWLSERCPGEPKPEDAADWANRPSETPVMSTAATSRLPSPSPSHNPQAAPRAPRKRTGRPPSGTDSVDRPDVRGRAAPAVSAGRVEADAQHLNGDAGRLNRSMREDGDHEDEV
jgi:hypothetical protein